MNDDVLRVAMDAVDTIIRAEHPALSKSRPILPTLPRALSIDSVLEERAATHGDFTEDAKTAQALKYVMRQSPNWEDMPDHMREALEQMQTKVARILAGDFRHPDHWRDLQGYPRLVEQRL